MKLLKLTIVCIFSIKYEFTVSFPNPSVTKFNEAEQLKQSLSKILGEKKISKEQIDFDYDNVLKVKNSLRIIGRSEIKSKTDIDGNRFSVTNSYTDFTNEPVKAPWEFQGRTLAMEGTFQNPIVSFIYERGWRQSFNARGFPGIEKVLIERNFWKWKIFFDQSQAPNRL
mmetsp:Transcript_19710/g.27772  ORF Transcript_19710/g.27772 Transcript_19710/m.27772 type:complete len:169 (+) Transcript_19710:9-515(+)